MQENKNNTTPASKTKNVTLYVVIFIIVVVVIAFVSIDRKTKAPLGNLGQNEKVENNQVQKLDIKDTNNMQDIKQDTKQVAKKGDILSVNYTGRLTNGTVFDSNVDPKFQHVQPFEFKLGFDNVIQGWHEGFIGMKVGEKKTLTIPPEKAYGATDYGPIPANSTLIFDVELLGIKN